MAKKIVIKKKKYKALISNTLKQATAINAANIQIGKMTNNAVDVICDLSRTRQELVVVKADRDNAKTVLRTIQLEHQQLVANVEELLGLNEKEKATVIDQIKKQIHETADGVRLLQEHVILKNCYDHAKVVLAATRIENQQLVAEVQRLKQHNLNLSNELTTCQASLIKVPVEQTTDTSKQNSDITNSETASVGTSNVTKVGEFDLTATLTKQPVGYGDEPYDRATAFLNAAPMAFTCGITDRSEDKLVESEQDNQDMTSGSRYLEQSPPTLEQYLAIK